MEIRHRLRRAARIASLLASHSIILNAFALIELQKSRVAETTYSVLADSQVRRQQNEVERIRMMVANGTLPQAKLREAQEKLKDVQDQNTLAHTLYGSTRVEEMTEAQAKSMEEATQRRVARQQKVVDEQKKLLELGIVARTGLENATAELEARKQVLDLVGTRLDLLEELKRMAQSERLATPGLLNMQEAIARNAVTLFNGTAIFKLKELATLAAQFQKKFGHALPVSAVGETAVHRALGLDHRGRVDIALNPDSREGVWLRQLLEKLKLPYLAFRTAVAGAATAPHIHIGLGSSRLPSGRPSD